MKTSKILKGLLALFVVSLLLPIIGGASALVAAPIFATKGSTILKVVGAGMIMPGGQSPNRKIVRVANAFSPSNLKVGNQQASTRNVYDYIKLGTNPNPTTLEFFKNVNQKAFPFTNLQQNKFDAGESLAVIRMHLSVLMVATGTSGATARIDRVVSPDFSNELNKLWRSDLDFFIDNNRVIKALSVTSFKGDFNHTAKWGGIAAAYDSVQETLEVREAAHCVFELDDAMIIPELITFRAPLLIPAVPNALSNTWDVYLGLHLEGFAALVSPKTKF